jgi:hypothetical protein
MTGASRARLGDHVAVTIDLAHWSGVHRPQRIRRPTCTMDAPPPCWPSVITPAWSRTPRILSASCCGPPRLETLAHAVWVNPPKTIAVQGCLERVDTARIKGNATPDQEPVWRAWVASFRRLSALDDRDRENLRTDLGFSDADLTLLVAEARAHPKREEKCLKR